MEVKLYMGILSRKQWLVVPTFLATLLATLLFTAGQPRTYEATASFVVRPLAALAVDRDLLAALETMSRRVEIGATYAAVADSDLIRAQAIETLGLSAEQRRGLAISSRLRAGTNILEITVRGRDPNVVHDMAHVVADALGRYIANLYELFTLDELDMANVPRRPVSPNVAANLILGGGMGLALAVALAFFVEYLEEPLENSVAFDIIEPVSGAHTETYLRHRLQQELSRSDRQGYALSLALLQFDSGDLAELPFARLRSGAWRALAALLDTYLREEDVLARLDDQVFALLLPDVSVEQAKVLIDRVQVRLGSASLRLPAYADYGLYLRLFAGVASYHHDGAGAQELVDRARCALRDAAMGARGRVRVDGGARGSGAGRSGPQGGDDAPSNGSEPQTEVSAVAERPD